MNATIANSPIDPSCPLLKSQPKDRLANAQEYQNLVGSLNHTAIFSCLDISYSVSQLSQFLTKLTSTHMAVARCIPRYLKGPKHFNIKYRRRNPGTNEVLFPCGFSDAS